MDQTANTNNAIMTSTPEESKACSLTKGNSARSQNVAHRLDYIGARDAISRDIDTSLLPLPIYTALDGSDCWSVEDVEAYLMEVRS